MGSGVFSFAGRHEAGRSRDGMSIVAQRVPDRLFSLLEGSSLTVWPGTGPWKYSPGVETPFGGFFKDNRNMPGRGRKIELCAARSFEGARGSRVSERKSARSIWDMGRPFGVGLYHRIFYGEFDSGSERTLAACLRHASRTGHFW